MTAAATVFETAWGFVAAVANQRGLLRLSFPMPTAERALAGAGAEGANRETALLAAVRGELERYFLGERVALDFPVDLDQLTPFRRRVLLAARQIPYGETRSYSWLARRVGRAGAARAVGQAMARNPVPLIIPCHRVAGADGGLVGFGGGIDLKRRLLAMESSPHKDGRS